MKRNGRVGAFLIVVAVVFVFVQREISVPAPVKSKFNRVGGLLRGPFLVRPQRKNRSGTDIEGQPLHRSIGVERSPTHDRCSCPEVVPLRLRQIETPGCGSGFGHRVYQQRRAEHELIANVLRTNIGAEFHHQRTHRGVALARGLPGKRVDIGQHAVAQAVKVHQDFLRLGPVRPQLVLIGLASSVHTKNRI